MSTFPLYIVEGTWGGADWAHVGSAFRVYVSSRGFEIHLRTEWWSGDVSGLPSWTASRKHSDWRIGAEFLGEALAHVPYESRNVLAHSHGGNVALYTAAGTHAAGDPCAGFDGVSIRRLVTIATPPRADMDAIATRAKPRLGAWLHVTDTRGDWMQRLGQVFDGRFGIPRTLQMQADRNLAIPRVNHSTLLTDPAKFGMWEDLGILPYVRGADAEIGAPDADIVV
jgi:hypothetical protein